MKKTLSLLLLSFGLVSASLAHNPRPSFDFTENKGQWPDQVHYKMVNGNATMWLESNCLTWMLIHPEDLALAHDITLADKETRLATPLRAHAYKVHFEGALNPEIVGQQPNSWYYNYFQGNDPAKWASEVQSFNTVRYANLYDEVGLRFYNSDNQLKYDFIVNAGADASQIMLRYEGVEGLELSNGNLKVITSVGEVIEQAPFAYQMDGSTLEEVACHYVVDGDHVSFAFPEGFDATRKLIIDPLVIASTLSGTVGEQNYGHSAAYDIEGNIYTGARSFGSGYPTTTGAVQENFGGGGGFGVDIAVSKLNPTGTDLLWASYLGGDQSDYPQSLVANDFGELYVYGSTSSTDFPTNADAISTELGGPSDIVVAHFSEDGTQLIGSTYVGGSAEDGQNNVTINGNDTFRGEIVLDVEQRPYVVSFSQSTDFPVTASAYQSDNAGNQDAVVFSMNEELSTITWATYFGGSDNDTGYGIRVRADGRVYITGVTTSDDLPATAGAYQTTFLGGGGFQSTDGYIASFEVNGGNTDLVACTFYASDEGDQSYFLDLDNAEDVFIYGQSQGDIGVVGDEVYNEPNGALFVAKFSANLEELLINAPVCPSEFGFGGTPVAFLVDRCDNVYISMYSASPGLTLTDDAVYQNGGFYLAAYGPDMETLEFVTYYPENHVDGGTSRFDPSGIVYQGVCSGGGFPTNADAWATDQATGWDIGVFKMDFQVSGVNASLTASAEAVNGCAPHTIEFSNFSVGNIFTWDFGDGSPENNDFEPTHTYTEAGVYEVSLISLDSLSCNIADTAYLEIVVSEPIDYIASFDLVYDCEEGVVQTNNTTGFEWLEYTWDMGDGTILEGFNVEHAYAEEGEYTVTLSADDQGCDNNDEVEQTIDVVGNVEAIADASTTQGCGNLEVAFENNSNGITYEWDFGDGSPVVTDENPIHVFTPGTYEVTLTAVNPESCNIEDETTLEIIVGEEQEIDAAFQLVQTDCEIFTVEGADQSVGENLTYSWNMGDGTTYDTPDISHDYASTGVYEVTLTITDEFCDYVDQQTLELNVLEETTAIIGNPDLEGCNPFNAVFENNSAGSTFTWDFGDGSAPLEGVQAEHVYTEPGEYTVTLTVEGLGNCGGTDVTTTTVNVLETPEIEALFEMQQAGACEALTVNFDNLSTGPDLQYDWNVNGTAYSVAEMEHVFEGAGTYSVELTITNELCENTDTFADQVTVIDGIDLAPQSDIYWCYYDESREINVQGPPEADYEWSTGEAGTSTVIEEPGIYTVTATLNNCTDSEGLEVIPVEELMLDANPVACEGIQTLLEIPYDGGSNYQWCDGSEVTFIYADEPGEYCYTFTDEFGCIQEGTINLEQIPEDASVYIPNAFTPNNDGVNDVFKAEGVDLEAFELTVWNRWGEEVFRTNDVNGFWDGSYQGGTHYVQDEVYTWRVTYTSLCSSEKVIRTGTVVMLR